MRVRLIAKDFAVPISVSPVFQRRIVCYWLIVARSGGFREQDLFVQGEASGLRTPVLSVELQGLNGLKFWNCE
jgi:hypothetical protein